MNGTGGIRGAEEIREEKGGRRGVEARSLSAQYKRADEGEGKEKKRRRGDERTFQFQTDPEVKNTIWTKHAHTLLCTVQYVVTKV